MMDQIVLWERSVFLWLNSPHTPFFDAFFYLISARWCWTGIVLFLIGWLFYKRSPREALFFILVAVVMMIVSDQLSSGLAKPFFARMRPTYHPFTADVVKHVFNDKGWGFGFFSGHATNFFAIATFTACVFKRKSYSWVIFSLVTIVAYSRIYLGKHFLSDVIVGTIVGILIGYAFYHLYKTLRIKLLLYTQTHKANPATTVSKPLPRLNEVFAPTVNILTYTLAIYFFTMVFFSADLVHILQNIGWY